MDILRSDFQYLARLKLVWSKFIGRTVLITGAAGFIPGYLTDFLLYLNGYHSAGIRILALVRNKKSALDRFKSNLGSSRFRLIIGDVSEKLKIREKVDYIVHAASQASPKYYSVDPVGTLKANVLGTYNLLELARTNRIKGFLFISAGEIYGKINKPGRSGERDYGYLDPLDVRSCYAESKRIGETMSVAYFKQFQVPVKIVRLYHTYGPGIKLNDGRVFADFAADIIANRNIVLKSDGSAVRSFIYVADTVAGALTVLHKGKSAEAYNLANEKATVSIKQLAELLVKLFPEKRLKVVFSRRRKTDSYLPSPIAVNQPATEKLRKLGWKPKFDLETGFGRTIKYLASNQVLKPEL